MAWKRINGCRYWYANRWESGKVVSRYVGPEGSLLATLASERAAIMREAREADRAIERARAERVRQQEADLDALVREALDLAAAELRRRGYHKHGGEWRRRRRGGRA